MISGGVPDQGHQHSHADAKGHVDTYDLCLCWRSLLMYMVWAPIGVHFGVLGLCCCWGPYRCAWSGLSRETMLVSVVCATAKDHVRPVVPAASGDHVGAYDPWCHQSLWMFMLLPETMWKSMVHSVAGCYEQGSFFCSGVYMTLDL